MRYPDKCPRCIDRQGFRTIKPWL